MSSAQKTLDLQHQVRRNAQDYCSQLTDLYDWEKDIKDKEKTIKDGPAAASDADVISVRSHVTVDSKGAQKADGNGNSKSANGADSSAASTPTEKQDLPVDPVAQQHKKANDIKDQGNSYVKLADYVRAIEAYTEAVKVYPYDPIYYINRALCYIKQECYIDCIEDCEMAISLDKLCVKAYYRRMQANESLGNHLEALKDCTTVLSIEPKNADAKKSLVRINDRLRKINSSISGPHFNKEHKDLVEILPIDKPVYKRSKQPMRRVPVVDIVTPREELRISDEDIDRIFNSYSGTIEEVKKDSLKSSPVKSALETMQENKKCSGKIIEQTNIPGKLAIAEDKNPLEIKEKISKSNPDLSHQKKVTQEDKIGIKKDKKVNGIAISQEKAGELNTEANQQSKKTPLEDKSVKRALPPTPMGTAQFYISWKELEAAQKYEYLKSIEVTKLCKILGAGFDSTTFGDILDVLYEYYVPNKEATTADVLLEMSKNDEFNILAMLMSADEKKMVSSIIKAIKNFGSDVEPTLLSTLSKVYNLT